jgi:acetyl esterase/lipase
LSKLTLLLFFLALANIQTQGQNHRDIVYAKIGNRNLLVDIYLPGHQPDPYLIVWIHGGAWHSGSKDTPPQEFINQGFALASVDYRLSVEAPFPAMINDIKAAIRFLRSNAKKYGYREDKIIVAGSSAGGHLAALIGTTNNDPDFEGDLGDHLATSSAVQATIDFFGPTNFLTILDQSTPHGLNVRAPALALLLGKPVEQVSDLANKASPKFQVDPSDPPIFIAHGDQDYQVPINQSIELHQAFKKAGVITQFEIVSGAGHGSKDYFTPEFIAKIVAFLREIL